MTDYKKLIAQKREALKEKAAVERPGAGDPTEIESAHQAALAAGKRRDRRRRIAGGDMDAAVDWMVDHIAGMKDEIAQQGRLDRSGVPVTKKNDW